jgi:hypothetical protein
MISVLLFPLLGTRTANRVDGAATSATPVASVETGEY